MRRTTRDDYERRVLRAQHLIESRLSERIAPPELARAAGMSLHHFHRVFRGVSGESVMQFTRRLRLERAARQLRASSGSVLAISVDAGYASHEAFTRAFSDAFGIAPSEYRKVEETPQYRAECASLLAPIPSVEVRSEPAHAVVSMRHVGPYREVSQTWNRLVGYYLQHAGEVFPAAEQGLPEMFGLVPDDPNITEEDKLRYDACLVVPPDLTETPLPPGPVSWGLVPGGLYAVLTHQGPYHTLHEGYLALIGGWFPDSGYVMAAEPVVERYLNGPQDTAPDDLLTEIRVRIEERGWLC